MMLPSDGGAHRMWERQGASFEGGPHIGNEQPACSLGFLPGGERSPNALAGKKKAASLPQR